MIVVGLTGGIATGKSTVSSQLKEKYKLTIVDADFIARDVVTPGKRAYNQIVETFADVPDLVNPENGELNRPVLGKAVFGNKERLSKLNSIVHPAVRREIFRQIFVAYISFKDIVVLDVPLLFESGLYRFCKLSITTSCTLENQLERLLARNPHLDKEDAIQRINSQMSNEERNYRSDIVIDNNKSVMDLHNSIDSVVREIKPNAIWTLLNLIPPIGIVSALYTMLINIAKEKYRGTKPPSKQD